MAKRSHPNVKYSGLWRPHPGDKHDLGTLRRMQDWFERDLKSAQDYYNKTLKPLVDANWSPTKGSFLEMVARAKRDIEISEANLEKIKTLIKKTESEQGK